MVLSEPGGVEARARPTAKNGSERPHVGPAQPAPLPPQDDEEHGGENARRRLREEGEREEHERRGAERARAAGCDGAAGSPFASRFTPRRRRAPRRRRQDSGVRGEQRQNERQRVLSLGHPGDRLHAHGVQREGRRGEPRAGQPEAAQEPPEEQRGGGVEQDVDEVVAERVQPPEALLDPERREDERVVLLVGAQGRSRSAAGPGAPSSVGFSVT